jgi:hypothetical protein
VVIININHIAFASLLLAVKAKYGHIITTDETVQVCGRGRVGAKLRGCRIGYVPVSVRVTVTSWTNVASLLLVKTEEFKQFCSPEKVDHLVHLQTQPVRDGIHSVCLEDRLFLQVIPPKFWPLSWHNKVGTAENVPHNLLMGKVQPLIHGVKQRITLLAKLVENRYEVVRQRTIAYGIACTNKLLRIENTKVSKRCIPLITATRPFGRRSTDKQERRRSGNLRFQGK